MPIFRGAGGAGDATNDATVTAVQAAATSAATSATNAANSATAAANSATGAATSATNASNSATTAAGQATTAAGHATNASTFATNSSLSADDAADSATEAAGYASQANDSEVAASTSASAAATSATNAGTSATNSAASAASALAIYGNTTAMNNAVASATASASAASTSASNASTSATTATNAASTATTQAAAALVSANNADADATAASIDANEAQAAATAATAALNNSLTIYGSIAAVQNAEANSLANRDAAAASATSASNSASTATTQAGIATTQANNAATSAAAASAVALGNEPVRHSVRPSLLLDFANTKTLDPRITFTRASTGTYYDGKTVAKAEENLFQYSQDFTPTGGVGGWSKTVTTITANTTVAPDGTTTASTITSTGTSAPRISQLKTPNGLYVFSVYLKQGTDRYIQLFESNLGINYANFDLQSGAVSTTGAGVTASITSAGSGWYRCSISRSTTPTADFAIGFTDNNPTAAFAPTLTNTGLTTFVWGAQLEQRSTVTAYTATTTAPITNYVPVLLSAPANVARFEHNPVTGESLGLEIEEQRTNLALYSGGVGGTGWTNQSGVTATTNATIAPDGTQTASLISFTTSATGSFQSSALGAGTYAMSVYVKRGNASTIQLGIVNVLVAINYNFDTGVIGGLAASTATATSVGNGWIRLAFTYACSAGTFGPSVLSNSASQTAFVWGVQFELGAFATSYVPTVASQVTRSADSASMTGTNFSSWYRADEGTLYNEFVPISVTGNGGAASINDASASNRIDMRNSGFSIVSVAATTQASMSVAGMTANSANKLAVSYAVNNFALVRNGGTPTTDTLGNIPVVTQLELGRLDNNSAFALGGTIKKFAYYAKKLTNAELQGLTTV